MLYKYHNIHSISAGFLLRRWAAVTLIIRAGFLLRRWAAVTLIIRGLISFRLESIDWEINQISFIIFSLWLTEGLFVEINFSKLFPNLKIAFSIAFKLISKLASCSCNRYSWSGICTYHTLCWRNSRRSDSWERGKSDKSVIVSCGYCNRCLIIIRR